MEYKPSLIKSAVGLVILVSVILVLLAIFELWTSDTPQWIKEPSIILLSAMLGGVAADVYLKVINQFSESLSNRCAKK
jgi:uncharacterized membrane protein